MSEQEQRLADLLKRVVPEPPRQLTYEEITVRTAERTVKSWLMPTLAAASVLVIGGAVGAVAATRSGQAGPGTPAAYQGTSRAGAATPSAQPTSPGCPPTPEPTASGSAGAKATPVPTPASTCPTTAPSAGAPATSPSAAVGAASPTTAPATASPTTAPATAPSTRTGPGKASVPNLVGQDSLTAVRQAESAGLTVVVEDKSAPATESVSNGVVWGQAPAAGSTVPVGTTVTLYAQS
jgi:PASTA domain